MRGLGALASAGAAGIATLVLVWPGAPAVQAGHAPVAADTLSSDDVDAVLHKAAEQLDDDTLAIAVVDRGGAILGVYVRPGTNDFSPDQAVTVARAAAFFTNDQALLFSRTVRSISGIHFPAGIPNTPNAALYGIDITNRGCKVNVPEGSPYLLLKQPRSIVGSLGRRPGARRPRRQPCEAGDTSGCAIGGPILDLEGVPLRSVGITTGKANLPDRDPAGDVEAGVNPGGAPLLRNGRLIGGVGVTGVSSDRAEFAATIAADTSGRGIGLGEKIPIPGGVFIDGIRLPFFSDCTTLECARNRLANSRPSGSAAGNYGHGGLLHGTKLHSGSAVPDGYLVEPRDAPDRLAGGLTRDEVRRIIEEGVSTANATRAVIRLPAGERSRMVLAVADSNGNILALYRMPDATVFSIDVALAKSRNAYYFSSREGYEVLRSYVESNPYDNYRWEPEPPGGQGWAMTARTLNYGGQPLFPPGIDLVRPATHGPGTRGPWFDLFVYDSANVCTQGPRQGARGADFPNQNGIVWFAGSAPLYKDGRLVGGLGVSGDGVEQDDFVSAGASVDFLAPPELRVDRSFIVTGRGSRLRLPYWVFPRNPTR